MVRRGGRYTVFGTSVLDEWRRRLGPADGVVEIFHGVPFFAPLWSRRPQVGMVHHVHLGHGAEFKVLLETRDLAQLDALYGDLHEAL